MLKNPFIATMFTIFNLLFSSVLIICANGLFDLNLLDEKHAVVFENRPLKKNDLFFGQDEYFVEEISKREQMMMTTKFGREFVCFLPMTEIEEEIVENEESVDEADDVDDTPYSDVTKLLNPLDSKPLDQTLFPRKDCYYYTNQNEWWGYEVCPRQEIVQFHLSAKTAGQEQISSLGKYSSDFDWITEEENSDTSNLFKKFSNLKTHVQYYSDGKICDITGKPRTTEIWWKCHGSGGTRLVRIEEPTTCNYIIHMHTSLMCSHEKFESDVGNTGSESKKNTPVLETVCYKAVSDSEFGAYQAKIAMEAQKKKEEEIKRDEILQKFELDAEKAMTKSVDNILSDISTDQLETESGTGEILNFQDMKAGLTDIFSKLVKKELEKMDDDASQSADLKSPESKIKTNLDKPIGEKFMEEDNSDVPDQLRELKKEVVENLKQNGQLQDGQDMQEIKIKILNVDENGRLVEGDLDNNAAAPKFTSQQLKQIKQALMGAIVKETPENGKEAQKSWEQDKSIYNEDEDADVTQFNHDEL